jgi:hypothetical protein
MEFALPHYKRNSIRRHKAIEALREFLDIKQDLGHDSPSRPMALAPTNNVSQATSIRLRRQSSNRPGAGFRNQTGQITPPTRAQDRVVPIIDYGSIASTPTSAVGKDFFAAAPVTSCRVRRSFFDDAAIRAPQVAAPQAPWLPPAAVNFWVARTSASCTAAITSSH